MVLFSFFFQFCEVGGLPIIHKGTQPNLVMSKRRKLKSFGALLHFGDMLEPRSKSKSSDFIKKFKVWQLWVVFFKKIICLNLFLLPNCENFPCQKENYHYIILCSCKNKSCHDQVYHQLCCLSSLFNLLLLSTKLVNPFIYSNCFLIKFIV